MDVQTKALYLISALRVASYSGPSHEKGESLVYTVCACTKLSQVFVGWPFTHFTYCAESLGQGTTMSSGRRLVTLPAGKIRPQRNRCPHKKMMIPCMRKQCILGSLPSCGRGLGMRLH